MKRLLSNVGWWAGGIVALTLLHLIFFVFVVVMDIAFGMAPQFAVPAFVPVLVVCSLVVSWIMRVHHSARVNSNSTSVAGTASRRGRRAPALQSAVIIRRHHATNHINPRGRRAYGATV